jgi:hypothetical protein
VLDVLVAGRVPGFQGFGDFVQDASSRFRRTHAHREEEIRRAFAAVPPGVLRDRAGAADGRPRGGELRV